MDKIAFPYRSDSHLPLLHVIAEGGFYEKYGLEVDYDRPIGSSEAHRAVAAGEIEFVGGNHVSTYGRRARGDDWVYLAQTVNTVPGRTLCVRADSEINGIADLREKVVGTRGHHPQLNDWLQLKQHGLDVDRGGIREVHATSLERIAAILSDNGNLVAVDVKIHVAHAPAKLPPDFRRMSL